MDEPGGMAGLRLGEPPSSVGVQKQTSEQKDTRGGVKEEANGLAGVREPPGRCHPCPTGFVECRAGGRSSTGPRFSETQGLRAAEGRRRATKLSQEVSACHQDDGSSHRDDASSQLVLAT